MLSATNKKFVADCISTKANKYVSVLAHFPMSCPFKPWMYCKDGLHIYFALTCKKTFLANPGGLNYLLGLYAFEPSMVRLLHPSSITYTAHASHPMAISFNITDTLAAYILWRYAATSMKNWHFWAPYYVKLAGDLNKQNLLELKYHRWGLQGICDCKIRRKLCSTSIQSIHISDLLAI